MSAQLTARKQHPSASEIYSDCFCYDESAVGLIAEPLVHSATAFIDHAIAAASFSPAEAVELQFSAEQQQLNLGDQYPVVELALQEFDSDGHTYTGTVIAPAAAQRQALAAQEDDTVWLCSHLLDYFETPPVLFFVQIKPVED